MINIIKHLFNHHMAHIGEAHFIKRNSTVEMTYNNKTHYADTTLDFDDFEAYLQRMDIQTADNEQMELF